MCEKWYDENRNVDFTNLIDEKIVTCAGHFSQLVWASSRQIGVGIAASADGRFYGVVQYKPAGNILDRFAQNVLPPLLLH